MTKKGTPDWVDNMNEDVVARDYWHYAHGGMPLRYTGGGYQHGYGHHEMYDYGADHSIRSSKTSRRSRRGGVTACCIFLLLLLGALLIAVGVGVMVYYLMRLDHPKTTKHITTQADGSVPLLNVNFTDAMRHNTSQEFLTVSNPLCREIDRYFRESKHKHRYRSCSIEELTPDENVETCECAGIISKSKTTRAYFNLVFLGDVSDIRDEVKRVIEDKTTKVVGEDYNVMLIDTFVVGISSIFPNGYSTPKPPPAVGVLVNLTFWVYNLTYTSELSNPLTTDFQDLAQPFCRDLTRIFLGSTFSGRYHSCEVKSFSPDPDKVIVNIWLTNDDITGIETGFRTIILDNARVISIDNRLRKIIGTLLITPEFGDDGPVIVIPVPVNPLTTIVPTPTTSIGPGYRRFIDMTLYLYDFVYNTSFASSKDPVFRSYSHNYCKALETILMQSSWNGHFYGCQLYGFYPKTAQDTYPYFGTYLGIDNVISEPREILNIIRTYGTLVRLENSSLIVYKIGDLSVILGGGMIEPGINITYLPTTMMMTSTMMSSQSLTPSITPSVFTLSTFMTPTPTPGQSVSPSASTIIIIYNSTTAFIGSGLYDFTYTNDLMDASSRKFLGIQEKFCNDLDAFFGDSTLKEEYLSCRIISFTPGGNTQIQFTLSFQHALNKRLQTDVRRIIESSAPPSQKGGYEVITIGDLDLIVSLTSYTASVTNYTDVTETSFQPTPTMTMEMTSTRYVTYSATLADVVCTVVSNIPSGLEQTSSPIFQNQQAQFCTVLESQFVPTIVDVYTHISCYIVKFERSTKTVRFHNIFGKALTAQFKSQILTAIYNFPITTVHGEPGHNIGGVGLKPGSCEITLMPVNYTDTMTVFPSIMPTSTVVQPTIDILHCLRQPCKNGGTCYEDEPGWHCQCAQGFIGKDCSVDVDDCLPVNPCQNNGVCIDGIASFECECVAGWTGPTCTIDVDECKTGTHMCGVGGNCVDNPGSYTCECFFGYVGKYCDTEVNRCETTPCENGGTCYKTGPGLFSCVCEVPWSGPVCADYLGVCQPNPCQNNGFCIDDDTRARCICPDQWTGDLCQNDVDECKDPLACNGNGLCVNEDGGYSCNCYTASYGALWTGDKCQLDVNECKLSIKLCVNGECVNQRGGYACICPDNFKGPTCSEDVDECPSFPCLYDGTCENTYGSYECKCADGYTGANCGTDVDECDPQPGPCENDGTCVNGFGSFKCDCRPGWTGKYCNEDVNECDDPLKCQHGGVCENKEGDYECNCTEEWSGKHCEIYSELCGNLRCLHGGVCNVVNGVGTCTCPPTRTGPRCETDVNECNSTEAICKNNGTCNNLVGSFYCVCLAGFNGDRCQYDINECDPNPCENDGVCLNTIGSFKCTCTDGWTGKYCGEDIPECDTKPSPCNEDHGACYELRGSYRCDCYVGWTGTDCNIDEDECDTVGCMNGGTCNNYPGTWNCTCPSEWTDELCQTDVDECRLPVQEQPCKNGATCSNSNGGYTCRCTDYFMGKDCDMDINECDLDTPPCLNGATCKNSYGNYECECAEGWKGKDCNEDVDECRLPVEEQPCKNGATCLNSNGGYSCGCTDYFMGKDCDIDINECDLDTPPCLNGATCENSYGNYECNCTEGWKGKDCDEDVDECRLPVEEQPCKNGATCSNSNGGYSCGCTDYFMGKDCDIDINECDLDTPPCLNGATCENRYGNYECNCTEGWKGKDCDEDVDECRLPVEEQPCKNGATCSNSNGGYSCGCTDYFMGKDCDIDINECDLDTPPCLNRATCENSYGNYECNCTEGWKGKDCDEDVDECRLPVEEQPCKNGATCSNSNGGYSCGCTDYFMGKDCDIDINECDLDTPPCLNGATCKNSYGNYECECTEGWKGKDCNEDINECDLDTPQCLNGATCKNSNGTYECECTEGWKGKDCNEDVDECRLPVEEQPCKNGATCSNSNGGYSCGCTDYFMGKDCDIDINECDLDTPPCLNGATCKNSYGNYECNCTEGWKGKDCDEDVDECRLPVGEQPCKNGATCSNSNGGYSCGCTDYFMGKDCDIDINECDLDTPPCLNGATCKNSYGNYECECTEGWKGKDCNEDINECDLDTPPCLNGATCKNSNGNYECECTEGWKGKDCNEDVDECRLPVEEQPCKNGATCSNSNGGYSCGCTDYFIGKDCDIDINKCELDKPPCMNRATCFGDYECKCTSGFKGKDCNKDINECEMDTPPCMNGATCKNSFGDYECECTSGFKGKDCNEDVNECDEDPCLNGGTCINSFGDYNCTCTAEWAGKDCDTNIDACSLIECENGACSKVGDIYMCVCNPGWQGPACNENIDECINNPCQNGGSCQDSLGSYECDCADGYQGRDCEDVLQFEVPIQFDLVEDVTELLDTTSPKFQEYASQFCDEMSTILSAEFVNYDGCEVTNYQDVLNERDKINWVAHFVMEAPSSVGNAIKNYILSSQTTVVGNANAIEIGRNYIYVSDHISAISMVFDLVDDVNSQPDLLNTSSGLFAEFSESFCNDISEIMTQSGLFQTYSNCTVTSYGTGPNEVSWEAFFLGPAQNLTSEAIKNYILTSRPTEVVGDVNAISIGNNIIYESDYISSFPIQFALVDDIGSEPMLLVPGSQLFLEYSEDFCQQIGFIMSETPFFPKYRSCDVVNYTASPNTINWMANFNGIVDIATGQNVKAYILESQDKVELGDYKVVEIGQNNIYYMDIVTDVTSERLLLNFTYNIDLAETNSGAFQRANESFCEAVGNLIDQNIDTFDKFHSCSILSFDQSPDNTGEYYVNYRLRFIGSQNAMELENDFYTMLETDLDTETIDRNLGYRLGDLVLFYDSLGAFTSVPMTYDLLNLTYIDALGDPASPDFIAHATLFCNDLILLVQETVSTPPSCNVNEFREGDDPFVHVDFTMEFMEVLDVAFMQDLISQKVFDEKSRVRVNDNVGNVVGDVVVYYDSLLDYIEIVYDGWIFNVTEDIFGIGKNDPKLNTSTSDFRELQSSICDAYNATIKPVEPRFHGCFIPEMRERTEEHPITSGVISLIFEEREPLLEDEILAHMRSFLPVPIGGTSYNFVGDYAVYITDYEDIKVNVSDYDLLFTTTTENPNIVVSTVQLQFQLINFTLTNDLADVTSDVFQQTETEFCTWQKGFDDIYEERVTFAKYVNCSLVRFSENETTGDNYVHVELVFKGNVMKEHEEVLRDTLIENGHRLDIIPDSGIRGIAVPQNSTTPTYLYFKSLQTDELISDVNIQQGGVTVPTPPVFLP